MWTFTTRGFFSTVLNGQRPGYVLLRFRHPQHAQNVLAFAYDRRPGKRPPIVETPQADYRWKFSLKREHYEDMMQRFAAEMDYTNFKGACHHLDADNELMAVWGAMLRLQHKVLDRKVRAERERDQLPLPLNGFRDHGAYPGPGEQWTPGEGRKLRKAAKP